MTEVAAAAMTRDQAERLTERIREAARDLNRASDEMARMRRAHPEAFTAQATPERLVYLIQAGEDGPVKIGSARDPQARLRALQTASPLKLRLHVTVPGGYAKERELHERFGYFRMNGEWCEPIPEIFDWFRMEAI